MKQKTLSYEPHSFEKKAWGGNQLVCGIDEVGRGCLAGPVVVSAVILPINCPKIFIDSKQLTARQRQKDYDWIINHCVVVLCHADHTTIDRLNIYQATKLLMHRASAMIFELCAGKKEQVRYLLSDAMPLNLHGAIMIKNLEIYHFNYGESISSTIAAASIVAKVTRDHLMTRMSGLFPLFGLDQHKGYATVMHRDAVHKNGLSLIHRRSFVLKEQRPVINEQPIDSDSNVKREPHGNIQLTLF